MNKTDIDKILNFINELMDSYTRSFLENENEVESLKKFNSIYNLKETNEDMILFHLPLGNIRSEEIAKDLFVGDYRTKEYFKRQAIYLEKKADEFEYNKYGTLVVSTLKKFTDFEGSEGDGLILRLLAYYIRESIEYGCPYIDSFIANPETSNKFSFSSSTIDRVTVLKCHVNKNLFIEYFIFFIIQRYPSTCRWVKTLGKFYIYKHHLIIFNNWLVFEQDAISRINFRIKRENENYNENNIVEYSNDAGVDVDIVYKRCLSRFLSRDVQPYLLLRNNCEHFGRYAFYGSPSSIQVTKLIFLTFSLTIFLPFFGINLVKETLYFVGVIFFLEYLTMKLWESYTFDTNGKKILCFFNFCSYAKSFGKFPR